MCQLLQILCALGNSCCVFRGGGTYIGIHRHTSCWEEKGQVTHSYMYSVYSEVRRARLQRVSHRLRQDVERPNVSRSLYKLSLKH